MEISHLLAIALGFLVVTVSPGPANIAVSMVAMRSGQREGIRFGLGLSVGLALWGLIAASGLGAILQTSTHLLTALKIIGGLYLLWLAAQSARAANQEPKELKTLDSERSWFLRGLILNLSNPKAVVAWMAALSLGLNSESGIHALVGATLICMLIGMGNYIGHAIIFSRPMMMHSYQRIRKWLERGAATLFALGGFGLLHSALNRS